MNKIEHEKLIFDHILRTLTNQELFAQWLGNFFYLNNELNKEYDAIYQNAFYVAFYELSTVGLEYSQNLLKHIKNSQNLEKIAFFEKLIKGLIDLKSLFSETEFEFIEYKRHSSSHIFQDYYVNRISVKGKIITKRKEKLIDEFNSNFKEILLKYGFDRGFDDYMTGKLYPEIKELYQELVKIKMHYNTL